MKERCYAFLINKTDAKMEITLLGLAVPGVLQQIKKLLTSQGFIVQTMPTANPVLIAYKKGSWFRSARQLIIEISSEQNNVTKLDITAIIENKDNSQRVEEIVVSDFVTKLKNVINHVTQRPYGI
jgi:hypothetical protein